MLVVAGILAVTLVLRAPITSVPPALPVLGPALQLGPVGVGLVTTLPLICFGVFAFLTPPLAARFGAERTLWLAVVVLLAGQLVRPLPLPEPFGATATFFAGTLLLGSGIAIGNVIVPAIARARFAHRLAPVMGTYTVCINLGGAAGSFATAPLLAAGWSWPWALGVWVVPTLLALAWWTFGLVAIRRHDDLAAIRTAPPTGLATIARRWLPWMIALVMGLQSLAFYSLLAWIPLIMRDHGFSLEAGGLASGLFSLCGLPGAYLGPWLAQSRRPGAAYGALGLAYSVALAMLLIPPLALAGAAASGLCQGVALAGALTFIAHQRRPEDVAAVSTLAQGGGYLLAAAGPVALGALVARTGSFVPGNLTLIVLVAVMTLACVAVSVAEREP